MSRAEAFRRYRLIGLGAAIVAGIATIIGAIFDPVAFFAAWLAAFWCCLALPLGALGLLTIHNMTGGEWWVTARGPLRAMTATMPFFILAFIPVLIGLHDLYSWVRTPDNANEWYLNLRFFGIRAAIYFIVWNFFALWQLRIETEAARSQFLSAIGLILLGYSVTWASIDWLMSIEPDWFSSVYGMMVGSGEFTIALAFALIAVVGLRDGAVEDQAFRRHLASLVTILLAVDIFWAYTAYSQWIIIWEENLRDEINWYLERSGAVWRAIIGAIIVAHLVVPLLTLVWTAAKRRPLLVRNVALLLLFGGMLDVWWLVLPAFRDPGLFWRAPLALIALGGLWLWLFLWRLERGHWLSAGPAPHLTEAKP